MGGKKSKGFDYYHDVVVQERESTKQAAAFKETDLRQIIIVLFSPN